MSSRRDFKPRDKAVKARKGAPLWIWLLTAALLALLVSGLVYLSKSAKHPVQPVANPAPPPKQAAPVEEEAPTPPASRFKFYDMLPNMEVTVPEPAGEGSNAATADASTYYLQAGSFRTHEQADARKAQLALTGLESTIHKADVDGNPTYRVLLGPYDNRRKADTVLRHIRDNNGDAILLKR